MTGDKLLDCREMFCHACDFFYCANLCKTFWQEDDKDLRPRVVPEAVNLAFACEIFLKTLLLFNDVKYKRKHKLEDLFNELPQKYKTEIENRCLLEYRTLHDSFGFSLLFNVSDAFEKWRYCYEHHNLQLKVGFLYIFAAILRDICSQELFGQHWQEYLGE